MKKLLALLFVIPSTMSAVLPVISYSSIANTDSVNKTANFYAQISAEAIKSAILNDQVSTIDGKKTHIGIDFSSDYYGNKKIGSTFGKLFNNRQGANYDPSDTVYVLYSTVFGRKPNGYKISDSFNDLKDADSVKPGTYLAKTIQGKNDNDTSPSSKTADTISGVSAAAQMVLGSDFSAGMASTITSMLTSITVQNAIKNKDIKKIFQDIDGVLTSSQSSISKVLSSLAQSNIDEKTTLGDQLQASLKQFFKGLIYIVSQEKYTYNGDINNAPRVFWNYLLNRDISSLTVAEKTTDNLISSVADLIPFGISLIHYFRSFDNTKNIQIKNGKYLFDKNKTNAQFKKKILDKKYIEGNQNDDYWYFDNDAHYVKLNLQNFASDLMMYLTPSNNGYKTLRFINILLGGVDSQKDDNNTDLNPIVKTAIQPLLNMVTSMINQYLDKAAVGPLEKTVKDLENKIEQLLTSTVSQLMEWIANDGYTNFSNIKVILESIKTLSAIIEKIKIDQSYLDEGQKNAIAVVYSIADFFTSSNINAFVSHPWSSFYNGNLLSMIANTRILKSSEKMRKIKYSLEQFANFENIVSVLSIKNISAYLGLIINKDLILPDWLYGLKDFSISKLLKTYVPAIYNTNESKNLSSNKDYTVSAEALINVVSSLSANTDGKNKNQIDVIQVREGKTIHVSPLMPIYYGIVYNGSAEALTGDEDFGTYKIKLPTSSNYQSIETSHPGKNNPDGLTTNISSSALDSLFGVVKENDRVFFSKGSLFYGISQLYGHNYSDKLQHKEMANGILSFLNILDKVGEFANSSIQKIINDSYLKYLDPKRWEIRNITQNNLNNDAANVKQTISYDIYYLNPDNEKNIASVYHISMWRQPYSDGPWHIRQIMLTKN